MAKVEVHVEETTEEVEHSALHEATRKLFLASLGAVSWAQEVMVDSFTKLVERGEQAEEEGKKLVQERMEERLTLLPRLSIGHAAGSVPGLA